MEDFRAVGSVSFHVPIPWCTEVFDVPRAEFACYVAYLDGDLLRPPQRTAGRRPRPLQTSPPRRLTGVAGMRRRLPDMPWVNPANPSFAIHRHWIQNVLNALDPHRKPDRGV